MLDEEDTRPDKGQYVYGHFLIPHTPYNLGAGCELIPNRSAWNGNTTHMCANNLVRDFLAKLSDMGRLDSSLVIVHSDHGLYYYPQKLNKDIRYEKLKITASDQSMLDIRPPWGKPTSSWTSNMIKARSAALALIKWPNQRANRKSNLDFQTINIAPTVLDHFGIDRSDIDAASIQDLEKEPSDSAHFFDIPNTWQQKGVKSVSRYARINGKWVFQGEIFSNQ